MVELALWYLNIFNAGTVFIYQNLTSICHYRYKLPLPCIHHGTVCLYMVLKVLTIAVFDMCHSELYIYMVLKVLVIHLACATVNWT